MIGAGYGESRTERGRDVNETDSSHLLLPLHASILIPGLHLDLRQAESGGQQRSLLGSQVLLALEVSLEVRQVVIGEHGPVSTTLDPAEVVAGVVDASTDQLTHVSRRNGWTAG